MKVRSFIWAFLLSMLLSILFESLKYSKREHLTYFQSLLVMTYACFGAFLTHLILFSLYYLFCHLGCESSGRDELDLFVNDCFSINLCFYSFNMRLEPFTAF